MVGAKTAKVIAYVRQLIDDDELQEGNRLPSATKLAAQLEVSQNLVLSAYRRLEAEGLLVVGRTIRALKLGSEIETGEEDRIFNHLLRRIVSKTAALGEQWTPREVGDDFGGYRAAAQFALLRLVDLGYLSHCHTGASYIVRSHEQDLSAMAHPLPDALWAALERQGLKTGTELPSMVALTRLVARDYPGVHFLSVRRAEHYLASIGRLTKLPSGRFTLAA